jgi:hypothetical protein
MASKIATLCTLLEAAEASDPLTTPLTLYAVRDTVNALRCRHPQDVLNRARKALKRYNVRVTFELGYLTVSTFNRSHIWREGALLGADAAASE